MVGPPGGLTAPPSRPLRSTHSRRSLVTHSTQHHGSNHLIPPSHPRQSPSIPPSPLCSTNPRVATGNLNQTRLLSPSHPSTWTVTQCPCSGKSTWLENQALNGASIPPWAGFRHFGDPADLRLTIRNRASGPAPVATIRSPSSGYLRSTSVVPPCYLRSTSVWHTEVLRRYYGGTRHW